MKKENIFDLFEQQHKDDQKQETERIPGEVKQEDIEPTNEATPDPKPEPEPKQPTPEPKPEPEQKEQEGENENGT